MTNSPPRHEGSGKVADEPADLGAMDRFKRLAKGLLTVSRKELAEQEKQHRAGQRAD
jgi:hypothetical protein